MTTHRQQTNEEMAHLAELVLRAAELLASEQYADALRAILLAQMSADLVSRHIVDAARTAGATWQDIGNVLGVTRQSAEQRFGTGTRRKQGTNETTEQQPAPPVEVDDGQEGTFTCPKCGKRQFIFDGLWDTVSDAEVCGDCAT